MLTALALTLKKLITLLVLVDPVAMVPILLAATETQDLETKRRFVKKISISVVIALLVATFLGVPLLSLLGVSLPAMQVGGGIIVLLLAIAMVLGKESNFKGSPADTNSAKPHDAAIVPLAIPLLAGPAAFSYVMGNSAWQSSWDIVHMVVPVLIIGWLCWFTFDIAVRAEKSLSQPILDVVERVGGFILAAMAIEMMAAGLRALFPLLGGHA